jgi:hypothetical protein
MSAEAVRGALAELTAATPWIDTHEHLVEERHRLRDAVYGFIPAGETEPLYVPPDWTALIAPYAVDDLVSAGMSDADARRVLRAVDLTTERLFGARLSRATCEEIAPGAATRPGPSRNSYSPSPSSAATSWWISAGRRSPGASQQARILRVDTCLAI